MLLTPWGLGGDRNVVQVLAAIQKSVRGTGARWLSVTNTLGQDRNQNKRMGIDWRHLNLLLPPFNFPPETESRNDHYPDEPSPLPLWRLADLPEVNL